MHSKGYCICVLRQWWAKIWTNRLLNTISWTMEYRSGRVLFGNVFNSISLLSEPQITSINYFISKNAMIHSQPGFIWLNNGKERFCEIPISNENTCWWKLRVKLRARYQCSTECFLWLVSCYQSCLLIGCTWCLSNMVSGSMPY